MLRLFKRPKWESPERVGTQGRLVYAVGDIHGRLDLLRRLIADIVANAAMANKDTRPVIVFLGDYVDRGPHSRGVIDQILQLAGASDFEIRSLLGNHEQAMLWFLKDAKTGRGWTAHGGAETLASYGVAPPQAQADDKAWEAARQALEAALPAQHLAFLRGLELYLEIGDYLFVHAGIKPGVPLEKQSQRDLLWIRDDFLNASYTGDKVVVHGHTPAPEPVFYAGRIGVDTGAYATGLLCAVRLYELETSVITAQLGPRRSMQTAGP